MSENPMDMIKGMLGSNADEKIKAAIGALSASGNETTDDSTGEMSQVVSDSTALDAATAESLMQIKSIIDNFSNSGNDSRSNLLMALRPYMRTTRQSSVDAAIRLLNISKLSGIFKLR